MDRGFVVATALLVAGLAGACGGGSSATGPGMSGSGGGATGAAFLSVSPQGGTTGVSTSTTIAFRFGGPMAAGMEQYFDLHRGGLDGPEVPMSCAWSGDRTALTCVPSAPLQAHTTYAIHMGGGLMDADDHPCVYDNGSAMGGQWITGGMMTGTHGGMGSGMMGAGWRNANGSYGMEFTFTTA